MEKLRNLHAKYVMEMTERNMMAQKKLEALHKEDWETAQHFVGLPCYHQGRAEVFAESETNRKKRYFTRMYKKDLITSGLCLILQKQDLHG